MTDHFIQIWADESTRGEVWRSVETAARGRLTTLYGSGEFLEEITDHLIANGALYYPVVGCRDFRVPCYIQSEPRLALFPLTPGSTLRSLGYLGPDHVAPNEAWVAADSTVTAAAVADSPIIIEIFTLPSPEEMVFLRRTVSLALNRKLCVINIQRNAGPHSNIQSKEEAGLLSLFLCGGRVRLSDWALMPGSSTVNCDKITYRSGWTMFRSPEICLASRHLFQSSESRLKSTVIDALARLFPGTWYLVGLGMVVDHRDYSAQKILMPHFWAYHDNALRYLQNARRRSSLRGSHRDTLVRINEICLQIHRALKECRETSAIRLVHLLDESARDIVDDQLWFGLAQLLSLLGKERSWYAALSLYARLEKQLVETQSNDPRTADSRMAAIENGRALILVKQRKYEEAKKAEERAITRLAGSSPDDLPLRHQLVLLKCHQGDLLLAKDISVAASLYRQAWILTFAPGFKPDATFYAGIRLGKALIRMKQDNQAEQVFKRLVEQSHGIMERDSLTAHVLRAEVLIRLDRPRSAAFHYWKIFRNAYTLPAEGLTKILANILLATPLVPPRVLQRANVSITTRTAAEADTQSWDQSIMRKWGNI